MGPESKSFIELDAECHFPIQNLPYGIFTRSGQPQPHVGVAIGNLVLDLAELEQLGLLSDYSDGPSIFLRDNDLFTIPRSDLGKDKS